MNNSFSLQQIQKTSNLDANSIFRQYKRNLMADFMRFKNENPKLKQSQIANQICLSTSTLQRYRNDINMLSPHRIDPNINNKRTKNASNTNFDDNSHHESKVKRPQMTSKDPNQSQNPIMKLNSLKVKTNRKVEQILKLTNTIQMKFWIIIIYKWN